MASFIKEQLASILGKYAKSPDNRVHCYAEFSFCP